MKRYPAPATTDRFQLNEALPAADLEFPIVPDLVSRAVRIDPQVMLKRIEKSMPWRNSQPGAEERRLAEKIAIGFVL